MIKIIHIIMLVCISVCALQSSASTLEISDLDDPKVAEAFVDGLVLPLMKNHKSPSGTVAITKAGKLIITKAYGYQNVDKELPAIADKTLFRPGSVSKLFTWVSVMQMVEQGKLDLDADINQYLKTFQIKDTYPGDPVTMRDIMTHSAGFEDGGIGYLIIEDIGRVIPLAEAMKRYQIERINPPGKQTAYSNYATSVAGLIVANLSGIEFTDYIQKNIFDVLGMKSSSFKEPLPDALNDNMAIAYSFEGGKYVEKPFEIISNFAPAGAQSATATDMVIFAQAILNGGEYNGARILKEATVKQMLTRNFSHDDRMMGIALGFYETEHNGLRFVGHGGDTSYFHSELVIDQQNDLTFFVSFSGEGGSKVRSAFKTNFYDAFYPVNKTKIVAPDDFAERAGKFAGTYLFWRSGFSKLEKALLLVSGLSVQPTAENTLLVAGFGKANQYVEIEKNLFQNVNNQSKLAFQENPAGEITGFVLDGIPFMSTFKAPFYYTGSFNFPLFGFSLLIFFGIILRRFYQRAEYKLLDGSEKTASRAVVIAAVTNWLTVIIFAIVIVAVGEQMFSEIPFAFKVWLIFPIAVVLSSLYLLYQTINVWKDGLLANRWARIRYSVITFGALFMSWFYYFWNLLGFNYFE